MDCSQCHLLFRTGAVEGLSLTRGCPCQLPIKHRAAYCPHAPHQVTPGGCGLAVRGRGTCGGTVMQHCYGTRHGRPAKREAAVCQRAALQRRCLGSCEAVQSIRHQLHPQHTIEIVFISRGINLLDNRQADRGKYGQNSIQSYGRHLPFWFLSNHVLYLKKGHPQTMLMESVNSQACKQLTAVARLQTQRL